MTYEFCFTFAFFAHFTFAAKSHWENANECKTLERSTVTEQKKNENKKCIVR